MLWCGKIIAISPIWMTPIYSVRRKWRLQREAAMRMEYGAGSYRVSWSSNPVGTRRQADLTTVCWFVAMGLSLTALFCALGYAESIGQALAFSG
jgi:hypothetical protein